MAETREIGKMNVEEMSALKSKYGEPLNTVDYLKYVVQPGMLVAIYAIIYTYFWWLAVIGFLLGAWYGYRKILPRIVHQEYFLNSLKERNVFITTMSAVLSDETKTVDQALTNTLPRIHGELKQDLLILRTQLVTSDRVKISLAYKELKYKYYEDVSFSQFLEQLESISLDGKNNLGSIKEIENQHSTMRDQQSKFMTIKKNAWINYVKRFIYLSIGMVLILTFSFGFKTSFVAVARAPIGWLTSGISFFLIIRELTSFTKNYFDESIMSTKKSKKK